MQLTKIIIAHGKEITEINLDEPTTGDLMDIGDPLIIGTDESIRFNNVLLGKYISRLGKIPISSVRDLSRGDFLSLKTEVIGFLGE